MTPHVSPLLHFVASLAHSSSVEMLATVALYLAMLTPLAFCFQRLTPAPAGNAADRARSRHPTR